MPRVHVPARTAYRVESSSGEYTLSVGTIVPQVDGPRSSAFSSIDLSDFVGQITRHVQWGRGDFGTWAARHDQVAQHVLGRNCVAAYQESSFGSPLAFTFFRRLEVGTEGEEPERRRRLAGLLGRSSMPRQYVYVLEQFNVTAMHDLREGGRTAERRLQAAAALAHALLKPLAPDAEVYIPLYEDDTREGYFFEKMMGCAPHDVPGENMLFTTAGDACRMLEENPLFGFLSTARLVTA